MGLYPFLLLIPCILLPVFSLGRERHLEEIQKFYNARTHTVRLFGSFDLGYYYVNLFVGSPPQKQTVIVDTGSSITAFPCSGTLTFKEGPNHVIMHRLSSWGVWKSYRPAFRYVNLENIQASRLHKLFGAVPMQKLR